MAAHKPDFAGFLLSHDTRQIGRTEASVERTYFRACLSKDGVVRSYGEVAHEVENVASANGIAVDHRNDGFGQRTYLFLHIEDIETGHAVATDITAATFDIHIAARAESLIASTRQDNDTDFGILPTDTKGIAHLPHR